MRDGRRERGTGRRANAPSPLFDAYLVVDYSASSTPVLGKDSIWWALVCRGARQAISRNVPTRALLLRELVDMLNGYLRGFRVLAGFDFPFGYPRGFAGALGHRKTGEAAWRSVWGRIRREVRDHPDNSNNRFLVAARLNREVSRGFGPFFGRPASAPEKVAAHLSPRKNGFFSFPLTLAKGALLGETRETDRRAKPASTSWFLYGGPNTAGSQALLGIPLLDRLREEVRGSVVFPFETGPRPPAQGRSRVVLAEVYPSRHHERRAGPEFHDRLQVEKTALFFAREDEAGQLEERFRAPPSDPEILFEEGWILDS